MRSGWLAGRAENARRTRTHSRLLVGLVAGPVVSFGVSAHAGDASETIVIVDDAPPRPAEDEAASASVIAREGALGFGVTFGVFGGQPKDQFCVFDTTAGTATKLADASDSFTSCDVVIDPSHERVYLTDGAAAKPRVHVYSFAAEPTLETSIDANPTVGLPPRELAWY